MNKSELQLAAEESFNKMMEDDRFKLLLQNKLALEIYLVAFAAGALYGVDSVVRR